jgi:flagellar hook assembly protein FlgD
MTTIAFSVGTPCRVKIEILDLSGRRVAVIVDDHYEAGSHTVKWAGLNTHGERVGSGVYCCRASIAGDAAHRKLILLK